MTINGVELDFDIYDVDILEKYNTGLQKIQDAAETVKGMEVVESIRTQCHAVFGFFDDLFGEGTHKKIFGDKTSLTKCLDALEQLVQESARQKEAVGAISEKYSPNRTQRRTKK